jgi:hypothetical protein
VVRSGPDADSAGPELGPQISGDFPDTWWLGEQGERPTQVRLAEQAGTEGERQSSPQDPAGVIMPRPIPIYRVILCA